MMHVMDFNKHSGIQTEWECSELIPDWVTGDTKEEQEAVLAYALGREYLFPDRCSVAKLDDKLGVGMFYTYNRYDFHDGKWDEHLSQIEAHAKNVEDDLSDCELFITKYGPDDDNVAASDLVLFFPVNGISDDFDRFQTRFSEVTALADKQFSHKARVARG